MGFRRHKGRGLFDCGSLSRTRLDIRAGVRPPSICSLNRIQLPIVRRNYAHRRLARLGSCTSWSPTGRRMWGCYQAGSPSQRTGRLRFGKETTFMRQRNRVMAGRPRPFVKLRIFAKAGVVLPRPNAREGRHSRALPILSRGVGRRRYRPQPCQSRLPARAS